MRGLLLLCLIGLSTSVASATIYRWVDANGTVTFRDTPPPVGTNAEIVEVAPSMSTGEVSQQGNGKKSGTTAAQQRNNSVEIYVTSWCPYCKQAEAFLRRNNIPFSAYDVEKDAAAAQRKNRLAGSSGVPFALINGTPVSGFSEARYRQLLGF